jgi:hypothetical protein
MVNLDNSALIRHTDVITGKRVHVVVSEPFSVGQHWICFKMIAEDGSHVIALIRLLRISRLLRQLVKRMSSTPWHARFLQ